MPYLFAAGKQAGFKYPLTSVEPGNRFCLWRRVAPALFFRPFSESVRGLTVSGGQSVRGLTCPDCCFEDTNAGKTRGQRPQAPT